MLGRLIYTIKPLKPNERVVYEYWVKKNGTDTFLRKQGFFVKKVRHSKKYFKIRGRVQMAVVRFDHSKTETRVPYEGLTRIAELKAQQEEVK